MKQFFLIPTLAVLILACQQQAVQPVSQKVLGTLEMQFGSTDNPIFSNSKLSTRAFTPKPDANIEATFDSFVTRDEGTVRTLTAVYLIKNKTLGTVNNLSLVAYAKSGNSNSSALKSINAFGGTPSSTNVKNVFPAQGTNGSVAVSEFNSDLQVYTTSEANVFTTDSRAASLMGNAEYALEYGFVVRQSGSTHLRSLAAGATGRVSLSMKIPVSADVATGSRFSLTFIVAENDDAHVVQSLEEPILGTEAAARASGVGLGTQVRVFGTSTSVATPKLTVAAVRIAGDSSAPVSMLYPTLKYQLLESEPIRDGYGTISNYLSAPHISRGFTVPSLTGIVSKVTLRSKINHTSRGDIQIRLTSPSNTRILLFSAPNTPSDGDNINVTFDDAASSTVSTACYNSSDTTCIGSVQPQNPLSGFNGSAVSGSWIIQVNDGIAGNTGTLEELELTISNSQ